MQRCVKQKVETRPLTLLLQPSSFSSYKLLCLGSAVCTDLITSTLFSRVQLHRGPAAGISIVLISALLDQCQVRGSTTSPWFPFSRLFLSSHPGTGYRTHFDMRRQLSRRLVFYNQILHDLKKSHVHTSCTCRVPWLLFMRCYK